MVSIGVDVLLDVNEILINQWDFTWLNKGEIKSKINKCKTERRTTRTRETLERKGVAAFKTTF